MPDRGTAAPERSVVSVDVLVDAPEQAVWDAVVDWEAQGDWVVGTRVSVVGERAHGLGARIEATTGLGRFAVRDPMVVIEWEPPHRCVVRHTGRLIRGTGVFEVFALPDGRSRFVWTERLRLPGGRFTAAGWPLVRPLVAAGVKVSLERLARGLGQSGSGRP